MKMFVSLSIYLMSYIPVLLIAVLTPYITRKSESFGVSIPEDIYFDPVVKKLRDNYRNHMLAAGGLICLIALVALLFIQREEVYFFLPFGTFVLLGAMFIFYIRGHRAMKTLKLERKWSSDKSEVTVIDTNFRNRKKLMASPLWFLTYAVVIAATVVFGILLYDKVPDKVPMHYNIQGEVDHWGQKSYKLLLFAPLMQCLMGALMVFSYWTIGKSKQQVDAVNPAKSIEQNRVFRYRWSMFTVFSGLALLVLFTFMQATMVGLITNPWLIVSLPMIFGGAIVIASIILTITTGQGGSRLNLIEQKTGEAAKQNIINRNDDRYWKLGMFYYNPEDPSIFIEKRFGIGWTQNFARPLSWIILIGLVVVFPLIIILFSKFLG